MAKAKVIPAVVESEPVPMILCEDGETRPVSEFAEWQAEYESE